VFDGFDQEEISRELNISPHTVHTHLDRLYRKLRVKSRCELVVLVFLAYLSGRSREGGPKLSAVQRALPRR
jgi:DNA-binding NarL/FixJ family response regulator